jgi:hypothetical protein
MYEQDRYANGSVSPAIQRRRRVAWGALALALVVVVGFLAGHGVGSSSKSGSATTKTVKPANVQQNVQATPEGQSAAEKRAARRRREKRREREAAAAQGTAPATPAPATTPAPASKPTPHVNTPQGRQELQQSPDCKNAPPPPPGYKGPVQC